jgi:hypothetical protein
LIRRSTAEYYIKYLLLHPRGFSDEQVEGEILGRGLDLPNKKAIKSLRGTLSPSLPFRPFDRTDVQSQCFISKHGIHSMFFRTREVAEAFTVLTHPRLKELVEGTLISGAHPSIISKLAYKHFPDSPVSMKGISKYRHYFWNLDLVDATELRALIKHRGDSPDDAFSREHKRDSRVVAADLPYGPASLVLSTARMGISPIQIDYAEMLSRMRIIAASKGYQAVCGDNWRDMEKARNCIAMVQGINEVLEKTARPEQVLVEKFHSLELTQDSHRLPHIRELSAGRHTTDLQPIDVHAEVMEVDEDA